MMKVFFRLLLAVFIFSAFKCDEPPGATDSNPLENNGPSKHDLRMAYRRTGALAVVYSSAEPTHTGKFLELIDSLKTTIRGQIRLEIIKDADLTSQTSRTLPLILLGRNFQSAVIDTLLAGLPFQMGKNHWTFDGKVYAEPTQSFKLDKFPNPLNDSLPVILMSGNSEKELIRTMESQRESGNFNLFFGAWGYEIYQQGEVMALGEFQDGNWEIDRNSQRDFSGLNDTLHRSRHFTFVNSGAGLTIEKLKDLEQSCEQKVEEIRLFTGGVAPFPQIKYYIYGSAEDKGLRLRDMSPAQANPAAGEVYVIDTPPFNGRHLHPENYIALETWLGKASKPFLKDGLAIFFTNQWRKKGYDYWANRLFQSGNLPGVAELIDDKRFLRGSPLIFGCAAASFTAFLLEDWGKEALFERYKNWKNLTSGEVERLQAAWDAYLAQKTKTFGVPSAPPKLVALKGFNFAHEGYQVYDGYGGKQAEASLGKLRKLGANSVALVPYGFMRDADKPAFIGVEHGPGGENDESVIQSAYFARQKGLLTVMKPQIWVSRAWPGDVRMTNEADWKLFFEYYSRWILHYALLAEMENMDVFCIGVEFAKATVSHPEAWKTIIRKIRGVYSGPLTYAANWGEEFENLTFWGDLDYIGLDCYYPLSEKEMPEKSELVAAFGNVLQKVEKISRQYQKPVIFTEIGFRSVATPWRNPHAERDGRPLDEKAQNLCYEVVFEGLRAKPWVAGVLWWKWPSYLDYNGDGGGCFTPNNKLAEAALKKWFAGLMED